MALPDRLWRACPRCTRGFSLTIASFCSPRSCHPGPRRCGQALARQLDPGTRGDEPVLEVVANATSSGLQLRAHGYRNLTTIDVSQPALKAQRVGACVLPFENDSFIATVSLDDGPLLGLDELVRVTRPRGFIVFSLKCDTEERGGFKAKFDILIKEKKWELVDVTEPMQLYRNSQTTNPPLRIWTFHVSVTKAG